MREKKKFFCVNCMNYFHSPFRLLTLAPLAEAQRGVVGGVGGVDVHDHALPRPRPIHDLDETGEGSVAFCRRFFLLVM